MKKKTFSLKKPAAVLLAASLAVPAASAASIAFAASGDSDSAASTTSAASTAADAKATAASASAGLKPVREAAAELGIKVDYQANDQTVTLTRGDVTLVLQPGLYKALLNGQPVDYKLSGPAVFEQAHTWISEDWLRSIFADGSAASGESAQNDPAARFLKLLAAGSGQEAYGMMSPDLQKAISAAQLDILWANYEQLYGNSGAIHLKSDTTNGVHREVVYGVQAAAAPFTISIRLNPAGLIDDLYLTAQTPDVYQKPAYDQPNLYTEQEITIGSGEFALPGTLTKPAGTKGPYPVVVLVHGSGPEDRDSAVYGAKPFHDIAVGLAAKGIATLRYDKVTYEHTFKVAANPQFTLKNETVDDAIKAVELLENMPDIDVSRIVVAGHSQGGFAMPLITAADQGHQIAGTILLSAPSSRFIDVTTSQQDELISRIKKLGEDPAPYEQQAAVWKNIAELVNDPAYSVDHLPANFPVPPAYWWYEQRDYVPVQAAKQQSGPMLILQGENDWQVPMSEFAGWKSGLAGRQDVEFKSYPKVNHLLSETDVLSTGAEYMTPSNVSEQIISDMADWVMKLNP